MAIMTRTVLSRYKIVAVRSALQVRKYAQPVGVANSVDSRFGITAPPPPRPWDSDDTTPTAKKGEASFLVHPRPDNPNDLSKLLRDTAPLSSSSSSVNSSSSSPRRTTKATLQSVKGTAIAQAQRRATTGVPTDDLPLMPGESGVTNQNSPVKAQPIDREQPHSIDSLSGRNELDERVLQAARAVHASGQGASLGKLWKLFEREAGRVLPIELPYESAPSQDRKVPIPQRPSSAATTAPPEVTGDDGVLLLAYVDDVAASRGQEKISVCTGFAVEGGKELAAFNRDDSGSSLSGSAGSQGKDEGHLVITVAHTLRNALSSARPGRGDGDGSGDQDRSVAVAITRDGDVYPVRTLLSSLPSADLVLLCIAKDPLPVVVKGKTKASLSRKVKTLPISPYPSPTNSHLLVSSFWGFEDDSSCSLPPFTFSPPRLILSERECSYLESRDSEKVKQEGDAMSQSRWGEVRLVEYKDGKGSEAQRGTYDSLETMEYKLVWDSPINPKVLRGEELAFVPGVGATHHHANAHAYADQGAASSATPPISSLSTSSTAVSRGFGGYGVPNFPPPGSSGGPIVDYETGAVVGVTRGCKMSSLGGRRGEGIPSEKICEFFTLPGLGKKVKSPK